MFTETGCTLATSRMFQLNFCMLLIIVLIHLYLSSPLSDNAIDYLAFDRGKVQENLRGLEYYFLDNRNMKNDVFKLRLANHSHRHFENEATILKAFKRLKPLVRFSCLRFGFKFF